MGAGISTREIDRQEAFVHRNFNDVKNQLSCIKENGYNRYNDTQIKSKLREEYYGNKNNNNYILDYDWRTVNNNKLNNPYNR